MMTDELAGGVSEGKGCLKKIIAELFNGKDPNDGQSDRGFSVQQTVK